MFVTCLANAKNWKLMFIVPSSGKSISCVEMPRLHWDEVSPVTKTQVKGRMHTQIKVVKCRGNPVIKR